MKVNVNGTTYLIHFSTRTHLSDPERNPEVRQLADVKCIINAVHEDGSKVELAEGESRQNFKDPCNHVQGRKVALAHAFKKIHHIFSKADRTKIWDEYKRSLRY